ncbi:glycoside hydrolase family 15 protein, partial [bacterium]|nr:glycoside hydrolase family 15 protein [bacterium]
RVECRPVDGWSKKPLTGVQDGHSRVYQHGSDRLVLWSSASLPTGQALHAPLFLCLEWNPNAFPTPQALVTERERTSDYWNTWVKHCSIPTLYQQQTIRSALALKLHCFEETGAILAALTTSLPEEAGATRNWDYRFCWLRDAYFSLSALRNLGHFEEMEAFVEFVVRLSESPENEGRLRPVYRLDGTLPLPEVEHPAWKGLAGSQPVRSGNQAAEHIQNDVYGEMALTLSPIFFDDRLHHLRTPRVEALFEVLATRCSQTLGEADAGLWEVRHGWQEHSFSTLLNWAGLERARRVQECGWLKTLKIDLSAEIERARHALVRACQDGALLNGPTDPTADAALLLLPVLGFPDEEICRRTVARTWKDLRFEGVGEIGAYLFRYLRPDDFGTPKAPFLICSFWLVQALAKMGQNEEAHKVMRTILSSANSLGLLAEHFDPAASKQSGNFPQAYSHVGVINAAFAISPPWNGWP